jgi:hypothetical protein
MERAPLVGIGSFRPVVGFRFKMGRGRGLFNREAQRCKFGEKELSHKKPPEGGF